MPDDPLDAIARARPVLRAVAETVVPEAAALDAEGWRELESVVGAALAERDPKLLGQLRALLAAIRWLPVLRWGRTFPHLSPDARRRFLAGMQDAPLLLVRRGFWGLRTLCLMGYYGREEARREIGYDARLRGRRSRETPTTGRRRGAVLDSTPRRDR